ncbi:MAG: hypothetical protein HY332_01760 [Chloroflexi bacterium]|nr:hypothetical protein [Chloroflexota bacterium]
MTSAPEDEPPVRDLPIYDPDFLSYHPDLAAGELASLVRVAYRCQREFDRGTVSEPYAYERDLVGDWRRAH